MSWSSYKKHALWVSRPCIKGIFLIVLFFSSSAFASWKLVAQFSTSVGASFFFNEQRGFIGMDGYNGIKRTSDGGKTWKDCITPFPLLYYGFITDIFMKDSLNGWAGIENDNFSHGLWYTKDGGVTWLEDLNVTGQVTSVYQTSSAVLFGDRWSINRLSISTNIGLNFVKGSTNKYNGINFVDDLHGAASPYNPIVGAAIPLLYTSDGGLTWQKSNNGAMTTEAWGVYAQKGTSNFICAGEIAILDPSPTDP